MDSTKRADIAYEVDSNINSDSSLRFTAPTTDSAHPAVSLRPGFLGRMRQRWSSLDLGSYRVRLVAGVVISALAGGVAGGLLAAANNNQKQHIDKSTLTAGAEAPAQTDDLEMETPPNSSKQSQVEFDGPAVDRAITELRKRRSTSRSKKAYRVAVIRPNQR